MLNLSVRFVYSPDNDHGVGASLNHSNRTGSINDSLNRFRLEERKEMSRMEGWNEFTLMIDSCQSLMMMMVKVMWSSEVNEMDTSSEDASRVSFRVDVFPDFCGFFKNVLMTQSDGRNVLTIYLEYDSCFWRHRR